MVVPAGPSRDRHEAATWPLRWPWYFSMGPRRTRVEEVCKARRGGPRRTTAFSGWKPAVQIAADSSTSSGWLPPLTHVVADGRERAGEACDVADFDILLLRDRGVGRAGEQGRHQEICQADHQGAKMVPALADPPVDAVERARSDDQPGDDARRHQIPHQDPVIASRIMGGFQKVLGPKTVNVARRRRFNIHRNSSPRD